MRALVFDGQLRLDDHYPTPEADHDEVVIRVRLAGICNTDLEISRGYMGFHGVLGHEFVGEVVAAPSDPALVGARVVGEINAHCATCPGCAVAIRHHCPGRTVLGILGRDGAMAEYVRLPRENLHRLPDSVADEDAVFVEPLAAAFNVLESAHVKPSDTVLVLGDGKLGQLVARVTRLVGCAVTVAGKHPAKLALLRDTGVATLLVDTLPSAKWDVVIDCTGSATGFAVAVAHTRPRGVVALKSTVADRTAIDLAPIVVDEITVVGSRCGPFAPAIRALADGRVAVRSLIAATVPLADAIAGFALAATPGVLKVLVRP